MDDMLADLAAAAPSLGNDEDLQQMLKLSIE